MMYHEEEIRELIRRFEIRQLPKIEWTHEAHLLVAIWYLWNYEMDEASYLVRKRITAHNESVGTPNTETEGYHETITLFWLWNAGKFLEKNRFESLTEAVNAFIGSETGKSAYPLEFYSKDVLFSVKARFEFLPSDLKELDE